MRDSGHDSDNDEDDDEDDEAGRENNQMTRNLQPLYTPSPHTRNHVWSRRKPPPFLHALGLIIAGLMLG